MNPFGYLFILSGAALLRQVIVGRVTDTPTDLRDISVALLNGDTKTVAEVVGRRGTNIPSPAFSVVNAGEGSSGAVANTALIAEVQKLGNAAKGYKWGATGPEYYDCSGIIWRAMKNLGIYNGPRFVTATLPMVANMQSWNELSTPVPGCIVNWAGQHMGIVLSDDSYYSARNVSKGIGVASLSQDISYFTSSPAYFEVK